jgi:hypothetical protein
MRRELEGKSKMRIESGILRSPASIEKFSKEEWRSPKGRISKVHSPEMKSTGRIEG